PGPRRRETRGAQPLTLAGARGAERALAEEAGKALPPPPADEYAAMEGLGNKAIALKNCRRVTIRDLTIYRAGHFAILPTGVDDFTIDNVRIDTQRDGL